MIVVKNIQKKFVIEEGKRSRYVLRDINLIFPDKGFVSILGPSGCGKTTFLNILSTMDTPDEGEIFINGVDITKFSEQQKVEYRHLKMGYIYQDYNLVRHLNVYDNIRLAFDLGSTIPKDQEDARVHALMEDFGIAHLSRRFTTSLSGGERERVAIARALANNPDIIFADEPTGALDDENAEEVMRILKKLSKRKLVLMVSHNESLVEKYSDRVIRFHDGYVFFDSNPLLAEPKNKNKVVKSEHRYLSLFKLAHKRIFNKKGRYIFLSVLNTISVIGIAIALGVYAGSQKFSYNAQQDALKTYPLTVSNVFYGTGNSFLDGGADLYPNDGKIHRISDDQSTTHVNSITSDYVKYIRDEFDKNGIDQNCLVLKKGLAPQIVTLGDNGDAVTFEATDITTFTGFESLIVNAANYFRPLMGGLDTLQDTYDVVYGNLPEKDDDLLLVLDNHDSFPTYMLDLMGYKSETIEYSDIVQHDFKFVNNDEFYNRRTVLDDPGVTGKFMKSNEVLAADGKQADQIQSLLLEAATLYQKGGQDNINQMLTKLDEVETYFEDTPTNKKLAYYTQVSSLLNLYEDTSKGHVMKVCGIVRPKRHELFPYLTPGFYYSREYSDLFLKENMESDLAKEYQNHITYDRTEEGRKGALELPDVYNLIDNNRKVKNEMPAVYTYLLARKSFGVDESVYQLEIVARDFKTKEIILKILDAWNDNHQGIYKIYYSDIGAMIVNMVKRYVGILVAVLVAVIALVMISSFLVTSLIAILEIYSRTTEIGLYRSLGASKSYVRSLFMVEQGMTGLFSGVVGIGLTYALIPALNKFIEKSISAAVISNFIVLQWYNAIIVAIIALIVGVLSALGPAIIATKKKPSLSMRNI